MPIRCYPIYYNLPEFKETLKFAVISGEFEQRGFIIEEWLIKMQSTLQTVKTGTAMFPKAFLSENLALLQW